MKFDNVYSFFGADSKVGTTMLATSVGEILSEDNKVLLINANRRPSIDYAGPNVSVKGIDEVLNKLSSKIFGFEDLEKIIIQSNKLSIVPGVQEIEKCRHFMPEYIEEVLKSAHELYDVILIDAGSEFEFSGMAVGALTNTENTVLVTTQQEKTWNELQRVVPLAEKLKVKFKYLLVNKHQAKASEFVKVTEIKEFCGIEQALENIPHSPYSWQCESDYKTLSSLDPAYKNKITEVAKHIASDLGLKIDQKKKFGLFGRK